MSDKVREKFEAWYAINYPDGWGTVKCRLQRDQTVNEACAASMQADKDKLEAEFQDYMIKKVELVERYEARVKELEYIISSLNLPKHCNILFPEKD